VRVDRPELVVDEDEAVDGRRCGAKENSTGIKLAGSFPAMMAVMVMLALRSGQVAELVVLVMLEREWMMSFIEDGEQVMHVV
jgi:hypothetical protein